MLIYVEERKKIILMLRIIIYANAFLFFHPLFWISHRTGRSFSICNYYWILYMYVYVYTGNVYRNVLYGWKIYIQTMPFNVFLIRDSIIISYVDTCWQKFLHVLLSQFRRWAPSLGQFPRIFIPSNHQWQLFCAHT